MDYSKIDNIVFGNVLIEDYPDFSDAFILSAEYDGIEMTDEQLDEINQDCQFIHDELIKDNLFL